MTDGPPTLRMTEAEQEQAASAVPLDVRTLENVRVLAFDKLSDTNPHNAGIWMVIEIVDELIRYAQARCP